MTLFKRQKRNKYAKIPMKHKLQFLKKVIQLKQPLKITADLFKINYSTAKTLIRQYRSDIIQLDLTEYQNTESGNNYQNSQNMKRSNFKFLDRDNRSVQSSIINFSCSQNLISKEKNSEPKGYILQWPSNQKVENKIKIISRIQFN